MRCPNAIGRGLCGYSRIYTDFARRLWRKSASNQDCEVAILESEKICIVGARLASPASHDIDASGRASPAPTENVSVRKYRLNRKCVDKNPKAVYYTCGTKLFGHACAGCRADVREKRWREYFYVLGLASTEGGQMFCRFYPKGGENHGVL